MIMKDSLLIKEPILSIAIIFVFGMLGGAVFRPVELGFAITALPALALTFLIRGEASQ